MNPAERPTHTDTQYTQNSFSDSELAILMNDASIDQMLALDTSLRVIAWNAACEDITGIPRANVLGKAFYELRPAARDFPHIDEALQMALKGFKSFLPWEKCAYVPYSEHHFVPLRKDDSVIGVLIVIHDVAHRIKAENELKVLNKVLAKKNRELLHKSEEIANFNWIASHDLKEPLRKIYTFIEMVATKEGIKLTDAARTNLRRAQSAVQRMGLLTDDIVTFSQVTAMTEPLSEVALSAVLASCLESITSTVEQKGACIAADELPSIWGYPTMLKLLFTHLLSNALKFHEPDAQPGISINYSFVTGNQLEHTEVDPDSAYHCISIKDNGVGFDIQYTEKIFGMFQRLHQPGQFKGTGMGLPICRKVAEAHEGFIVARSTPGEGSTFTCYLKNLEAPVAIEVAVQ